jgi:hypothetical protein
LSQLKIGKSDEDLAAELRAELAAALRPALAIMDKAMAAGIILEYSVAMSVMGKYEITAIRAVKPL